MKTIISVIAVLAMVGCMTATYRGTEIKNRLAETDGLAAHDISIDEDPAGDVTLNGNVASDRDRNTIERVARNTNGVRDVRNNLVVDPSFVAVREGNNSSSHGQRAIVSDITAKVSSSPELRNYTISVDATDGAVVLRGDVGNENERSAAEQIARNTRGVTSVRNEIVIAPSAKSDFQISENVREALRRRTDLDLRNVEITTRDSIVTLRGSQESDRDIDYLVSSTRHVAGVRDVRNELTLNSRQFIYRYPER